MSLKGVELQIAIPKTFDAGKLSDQMNQQQLANQAAASEATDQFIQKKRTTVIETESAERTSEEGNQSSDHSSEHSNENEDQVHDPQMKHPYKGNFFDFSG